jgi:hypothetical protein
MVALYWQAGCALRIPHQCTHIFRKVAERARATLLIDEVQIRLALAMYSARPFRLGPASILDPSRTVIDLGSVHVQ